MKRWQLWTYDVWGNAKDGFEVNDRYKKQIIEIEENPTDDQILKAIATSCNCEVNNLELDGDDTVIYITEEKNGRPLAELELITWEN